MDYNKIREIEENEKLSLKDEQAWNTFDNANQSGYGRTIMNYAERWAKTMQYLMREENKTVAEAAVETVDACDFSGITGGMYNYAVQVLEQCWEYGDQLKQWQDNKFNSHEPEQVETM